MSIRLASRMSNLGTEGAFEVLARARALEAQGREIVHLEIGEPDFATPSNIIEAAYTALQNGATHYTPAGGIMEVREATARYVGKWTGVHPEPTQVVLVPGSKNILHFALLSLVEPGDEVIYPDSGGTPASSAASPPRAACSARAPSAARRARSASRGARAIQAPGSSPTSRTPLRLQAAARATSAPAALPVTAQASTR